MEWAKRVLTVFLTFAITQFGVLATAPAHAHESEATHGVRSVEIHPDWSLDERAAHGHEHHQSAEAPGDPADDGRPGRGGKETLTHIHSCAPFAPVEAHGWAVTAAAIIPIPWPPNNSGAFPRASAPPDRPPRLFL